MLLRLFANNGSQLTVVNGATATGYTITGDIDWGQVNWQHAASGKRGTQGARPAVGEPDNRFPSIPIRIGPTGSVDSCNVKAALLCEIVDDMRRFGGQICWQGTGQTNRQWLEVMQAGVTRQSWGERGAVTDRATCTVLAEAAPYFLGDPMDTFDSFDVDSIADYTNDGSNGTFSVSGGALVPSATGFKRYRHTVKGYAYGDVQVTLKFTTGATITSGVWRVFARGDTAGADTKIVAELVAGTNVVRISKYVATVATSLATAAITPAANTTYWVRLRLEGNVATAEVFTTAPTPVSTPAQSVSYTLTSAEAALFTTGHVGLHPVVADTAERYQDFTVEPYTYRLLNAPEQIRLGGAIPGDVSAIADLTITPQGGNATPVWGLAGWIERPLVTNLCWNGDFESATIGTGGWFATAAPGIISAATSVARDTTAARCKYGAANLAIVCPATTDTGAHFTITYRFKKGRQYAVLLWASSASQTTSARVKLGISGDLATGTAAALSTTPKLYAVTWTPAADTGVAGVAFGINAATATTMNIDGGCVVEVPSCALSAAINSSVTALTPYKTPTEVPGLLADGSLATPFLFLIGTELMRCIAIDPVTGAWTTSRAAEGSTAASHSQDDLIIIVPPLRPHLEGKGASPAFGVIECESYVAALSDDGPGAFTIPTDANARGGFTLEWTPTTSGAQTATVVYFVDPNALVPDDYGLGEIDIEVWLREAWAATLGGVRVTVSALPEGGSTFGAARFTREFGNVGKMPWPASAKVMRQHRLGAIPMIVDRSDPQRWRLVLTLSCIGGASPTWDTDHFMLCATRSRLAGPTGEPNDTASGVGAYPSLVPYDAAWGSTSAMSRMLGSDMSSRISAPGAAGYPAAGLGDVIEIPDGDVDLLIKCSTLVPDDPTLDATVETSATLTTSVHAAITPRYTMARSS